jgi:hypothetical protein
LPDPGEGLWITFESDDRMTWTATFGPIRHPLGDTADFYATTTTFPLIALPENTATSIAGTLSSPSGTPNPDPVVWMEKSQDYDPSTQIGTWTRVGMDSSPVELDGDFVLTYARPSGENDWYYRAAFDTLGPFTGSVSKPVKASNSATVVSWNAANPVWQNPVTYSGTLAAGSGAPMTGQIVQVQIRVAGAWTTVASAGCAANGTWTTTWTQPKDLTVAIGMRAVYPGDATYDRSETVVKEVVAVTVPVTIAWSIPAMTVGVAKTITGTLSSTYGTPEPDRTLEFQMRPSGGAWTIPVRPIAAANGTFSFTYTAPYGIADYKMRFPGSGVYLAGESSVSAQQNSVTTTTSTISVPTTLYYGTSLVVSGTVTDQTGAAVKYGNVRIEQARPDASGGAWTTVVDVQIASNGAWSGTVPAPGYVGPVSYRGRYLGSSDGFYITSTGAQTDRNVELRAMGGLSRNAGDITFSSMATSWAAVTGATDYEVYHRGVSGGGWDYYTNTWGATSFSHGGLGGDTYHEYIVYPRRQRDGGGPWIYGGVSPSIAMNTGHPEVRKSGSFGREMRPQGTGSYRPDVGWGYIGDKPAQGYYTDAGRNYTGVMDYDENDFQNWVAGNWGWDVVGNLTFTVARVLMYRVSGVGSGSARGVWWYVSNSYPNGPVPQLAGGEARGSLTPGQAGWIDLPYPHWAKHVLLRENIGGNVGTVYSLATYRYNSTEYAQWLGASGAGNACNLYVECNWNFVTVNQQNPWWY